MAIKTGAKRHIHKYHKIGELWVCGLRNCTHYMPKNVAEMIVGKQSLCWTCGNVMILDEFNMEADKPTCNECNPVAVGIDEFLKSKGV